MKTITKKIHCLAPQFDHIIYMCNGVLVYSLSIEKGYLTHLGRAHCHYFKIKIKTDKQHVVVNQTLSAVNYII